MLLLCVDIILSVVPLLSVSLSLTLSSLSCSCVVGSSPEWFMLLFVCVALLLRVALVV